MAMYTVESKIYGYHEYFSKLLFESELDLLQYQYPYLNPYAKQIKVHLMLQRILHVTKTGKLAKKVGEL